MMLRMPLDVHGHEAALRIGAQMLFTRKGERCFCQAIGKTLVLYRGGNVRVIEDDRVASHAIGKLGFSALKRQDKPVKILTMPDFPIHSLTATPITRPKRRIGSLRRAIQVLLPDHSRHSLYAQAAGEISS